MTTAERHQAKFGHGYEPVIRANGYPECARCRREKQARRWREDEAYRVAHRGYAKVGAQKRAARLKRLEREVRKLRARLREGGK